MQHADRCSKIQSSRNLVQHSAGKCELASIARKKARLEYNSVRVQVRQMLFGGGSADDGQNNECASAPCRNGGSCVQHVGNYSCACTLEFTGRHCEREFRAAWTCPCVSMTFVDLYVNLLQHVPHESCLARAASCLLRLFTRELSLVIDKSTEARSLSFVSHTGTAFDESCGGSLVATTEKQYFASPGFAAGRYQNDLVCAWSILTVTQRPIILQFVVFELEDLVSGICVDGVAMSESGCTTCLSKAFHLLWCRNNISTGGKFAFQATLKRFWAHTAGRLAARCGPSASRPASCRSSS